MDVKSLFTPRSPQPFQLELEAGEVCPLPIPPHPRSPWPAGEDPIPGGQARLQPSEAVQPGGERGWHGGRSWILNPAGSPLAWDLCGLSSSTPGSPAWSHTGLSAPSPGALLTVPCFSWEFRPCWVSCLHPGVVLDLLQCFGSAVVWIPSPFPFSAVTNTGLLPHL